MNKNMTATKYEHCEEAFRRCTKSSQMKRRIKAMILAHRRKMRFLPVLGITTVVWYVHVFCWDERVPAAISLPDGINCSRNDELPGWHYNTSRNLSDYVLPENDTTLLEPRNICHDKIFLLIVVHSCVYDFAARQNIRSTWGNTTEFNYHMFKKLHENFYGKYLDPPPDRLQYYRDYIMGNMNGTNSQNLNMTSAPSAISVRVVFLIGRRKFNTLDNESIIRLHSELEQYDDIIQENFIDTYKNLTIKSVIALKWLTRRCLNATAFIMKCDDDTFVNVPNMLQYLLGGTLPIYNDTLNMHDSSYQELSEYNGLKATSNLLVGHLFNGSRPIADVASKWYMPYYMFPADIYPKYLSGSGYIMSSDVVPKLYAASLNTSLLYLEDIYITGICAECIKLRRSHNPLFNFEYFKSPCTMKGCLTQHGSKNFILDLYKFVCDLNVKCE